MHTQDALDLADHPVHFDARRWFEQGLRFESQDMAAAETAFREAIATDPTFDQAYMHLGALLSAHKRCDDALTVYDMALLQGRDTPNVHCGRGRVLEDLGRPMLAIPAYQRALDLDPELVMAHYRLGVLGDRLGDSISARIHFAECRRLEGGNRPAPRQLTLPHGQQQAQHEAFV